MKAKPRNRNKVPANQETELGLNRTGMAMAPLQAGAMRDNSKIGLALPGGLEATLELRKSYFDFAEPLGNVPYPSSLKGITKTVLKKLKGKRPEVFLDKLGERLAFERTGVRLYEEVIGRCTSESAGIPADLTSVLIDIRNDEAEHFLLVQKVIVAMGADPTCVTPAADAAAVASSGLLQLISDPRSSIAHCLQALLTLELMDNGGWRTLIGLASQLGAEEWETSFGKALNNEDAHLVRIQDAYTSAVMDELGVTLLDAA